MTGWWLFARCRRLPSSLGVLAACATVGLVLGVAQFRPREVSEFGIPWVTLLPVVMASVVSVSTDSPMGGFEAMRARSLVCTRLAHLGTLLGAAACGTWLVTHRLPPPFTEVAGLRNLALLAGMALVATRLVPARLSWLAPTVYGMATLLIGNDQGRTRPWAWLLMVDQTVPATVAAGAFFIAGVATAALLPVRRPRAPSMFAKLARQGARRWHPGRP